VSWLQLILHCERPAVAAAEDALLAAGAEAVTLADQADQPVFEPAVGETPLWDRVQVIGLFSADTDSAALLATLSAALGTLPDHRLEILEDQDWSRAWTSHYQPMRFGQRLWICPSWTPPPEPGAVNVLLDPGLAFGTGTHPTTALCLTWLDQQTLRGKTVIDYGCGSGILAIAALLLGAERALAVDNDPQALAATRDNARRNGIADARLITCLPGDVDATWRADITVANILAGPLIALAPRLAALTAANGRLALSGLLASQAETVAGAYRPHFAMQSPTQREEWVLLSGDRRGGPASD
jgi:ribosomal protein L11 methyltransferase